MDRTLADRLIAMAAEDLDVRARLAEDGSLFDGYHPRMQTVHESNAHALDRIMDATGWPTAERMGADGAEAAWLIAQHAIGLPAFQRRCLAMLKAAVVAGQAPAWQRAMMIDRVLVFEGRPQIYGTQFDWDEQGELSARPIEDLGGVDERRSTVGLEPLAMATARHRVESAARPRPRDLAEHRRRMDEWARQVGWR